MPKPLHVSWYQVMARRLERHALAAPRSPAPAEIAAAICGVHAQIFSAAELSIAVRNSAVTRADIQDALWSEHSLIKAWGPRGTVHLLAAKDLSLWAGALSALPVGRINMPENGRMTDKQTDEVIAAIAEALEDAELTLDELNTAVVDRAGAWAGDLVMPAFQTMWPRWRQAIDAAANRGVICFGPNRGRNITYTNPRRWLPGFRPLSEKKALAELVRRYLFAYGPATAAHFAQWLSAPARWAIDLFGSLGKNLAPVEVDGTAAWIAAGDTKFPAAKPKGVRLLPYFDSYAVGSHPRQVVFPGRAAERALSRGQAGNFPVLLVDGIVAGVWHQRRAGRIMHITVEPLGKLSATQRKELDAESQRLAEFFDLKPALTIGKVSVGAHA